MSVKSKLFTHEDPLHLHKIFGLYCIVNYFLQAFLYFNTSQYYINVYTITPHMLLHITSFIFKVMSKRPIQVKASMFIWNELRLHSLIFAWRSCLVIIYPTYSVHFTTLTLIAADVATYYYGTSNVSTVRGSHENIKKRSIIKNVAGAFFSISQISATIICAGFFKKSINPIVVFFTLPAIQTSAFGMTLLRKNLITKNTWTIVYTFELILNYIVAIKEDFNMFPIIMGVVLYFIRKQDYLFPVYIRKTYKYFMVG